MAVGKEEPPMGDENDFTALENSASAVLEVVGIPQPPVGFEYPDGCARQQIEDAATRIDEVNGWRVRFSVRCRLEVGAQLNKVRGILGYGKYGEWLAWRYPSWSEEATRRWRVMAERAAKNPEIVDALESFQSTTAAEEFVGLPEHVQRKVIEARAWTWNAYKAACWDAAMRERLTDGGLPFERRHGDVLHAIEDARADPALAEVAESLYRENRDTFARLSDRDPAEMDVETKAPRPEQPRGDAPGAQLVEQDDGPLFLCRRMLVDGQEQYWPVARVTAHLLMWNGSSDPAILAAFPEAKDGPAAASWREAAMDAACRRVNASRMNSVYGEVL